MDDITPRDERWPEGEAFHKLYPELFFAQNVVEFGCGDGRLAPLFQPRFYTGVDISRAAVDKAMRDNPGYDFYLIDETSKIEGGFALLAHNVLMHVPDADLSATIGRFTQRRIIVTEMLGRDYRREGNPPVFNREIEDYSRAFNAHNYRLKRVQFRPVKRYNDDIAILEFHLDL